MNEEIRCAIRSYIVESPVLRAPGPVDDSTPLAAHGILDSLAVLELVLFLETRFEIEFSARDLDRRHLETVARIADLVEEKVRQKATAEPT